MFLENLSDKMTGKITIKRNSIRATPPYELKKKPSKPKFQDSWLNEPTLKNWLEKVDGDLTKASCKICGKNLRAHHTDLIAHTRSDVHKTNATNSKINTTFKPVSSQNNITAFELKLAVFVCCHTSIATVDHLTELIKDHGTANNNLLYDKLHLHRTKCSTLIKNVISPSLLKEQIEDMKNVKFSLIIDESTDVSCNKHLSICVRYYNSRKNKIVSQFLGLVLVVRTTALDLYNHIKAFFEEIGIDLKNCFALATDGASNLCGKNNSVYTMLKNINNNLILVKCVCHSLHLACSYAAAELPSNIDYMLRETYNWFKRSSIKRNDYLKIYKLLNDGKEPLQLIQLSKTRWLARSQAVKRLLSQWDSIKTHFQLLNGQTLDANFNVTLHCFNENNTEDNTGENNTRINNTDENNTERDDTDGAILTNNSEIFQEASPEDQKCTQDRYIVRELGNMFNDPKNFLYFVFMHPILMEFEEMNLKFQREHCDQSLLLTDLETFALSLYGRILHPSHVSLIADFSFQSIYLPSDKVDFGNNFKEISTELISKKIITSANLSVVKLRCHQFLITACKEVSKRLSKQPELLHKMKNLSPSVCLSRNRPSFNELPLYLADKKDISKIECQWRRILNTDCKSIFSGEIPVRGDIFWSEMIRVKNSDGDLNFKELANLALTTYSFPVSNALVERTFSKVTFYKNLLRNRLALDLLSAMIRIKMLLEEDNKCCLNFIPNPDMLNYNSSIYNKYISCGDEERLFNVTKF